MGVDIFSYRKSWENIELKEVDFSVLRNQISAKF